MIQKSIKNGGAIERISQTTSTTALKNRVGEFMLQRCELCLRHGENRRSVLTIRNVSNLTANYLSKQGVSANLRSKSWKTHPSSQS
jgi:hypothetical protein